MSVSPIASMHSKARTPEYSGTNVKRFNVPEKFVDWAESFSDYKPVDYTSEKILAQPPYADPEIR